MEHRDIRSIKYFPEGKLYIFNDRILCTIKNNCDYDFWIHEFYRISQRLHIKPNIEHITL